MPLFHVQDADRPMWVIADNFQHAHSQWADKVGFENSINPEEVDPPQGIQYVCDAEDLLIPGLS